MHIFNEIHIWIVRCEIIHRYQGNDNDRVRYMDRVGQILIRTIKSSSWFFKQNKDKNFRHVFLKIEAIPILAFGGKKCLKVGNRTKNHILYIKKISNLLVNFSSEADKTRPIRLLKSWDISMLIMHYYEIWEIIFCAFYNNSYKIIETFAF